MIIEIFKNMVLQRFYVSKLLDNVTSVLLPSRKVSEQTIQQEESDSIASQQKLCNQAN